MKYAISNLLVIGQFSYLLPLSTPDRMYYYGTYVLPNTTLPVTSMMIFQQLYLDLAGNPTFITNTTGITYGKDS